MFTQTMHVRGHQADDEVITKRKKLPGETLHTTRLIREDLNSPHPR